MEKKKKQREDIENQHNADSTSGGDPFVLFRCDLSSFLQLMLIFQNLPNLHSDIRVSLWIPNFSKVPSRLATCQ